MTSYPFKSFHEENRVPSYDDHTDVVVCVSVHYLNTIVHHQIHERVKSSQNSRYLTITVQLEGQFTVHVFLQFGRIGLGHLEGWLDCSKYHALISVTICSLIFFICPH